MAEGLFSAISDELKSGPFKRPPGVSDYDLIAAVKQRIELIDKYLDQRQRRKAIQNELADVTGTELPSVDRDYLAILQSAGKPVQASSGTPLERLQAANKAALASRNAQKPPVQATAEQIEARAGMPISHLSPTRRRQVAYQIEAELRKEATS